MLSVVARYGRGSLIAAAIVAVNFAVAIDFTGLSYGRYQWTVYASISYDTPTNTPTSTPTATPTNTPIPIGGSCTAGTECASTFCVDGVCCNEICDQPGEFCNLPGNAGTCSMPTAPAPTLRGPWLAVTVLLLAAIALFALRARRTR